MRKNSKLIDSFLFSLKCKVPYQARVVSRSSRIRTGGYRVCGRSARPCTGTWLCARRICRPSQTHRLLLSHLQINIGIRSPRKQLQCSYNFRRKVANLIIIKFCRTRNSHFCRLSYPPSKAIFPVKAQ